MIQLHRKKVFEHLFKEVKFEQTSLSFLAFIRRKFKIH